jgi:signal peptidase II
VFVGAAALLLAADLASKSAAFRLVADKAIILRRPTDVDPHVFEETDTRLVIRSDRPGSIPQLHEGRKVVPLLLNLRLTTNTGAVFGMGKGRQWFFAVISVVAIGVIVRVFFRSSPGARVLHVCLGLVLAGALGNLYDRIMFDAVRDFFYLFPGVRLPFGLHWPNGDDRLYPWIFNVADVSLVVGVTILLLIIGRSGRPAAQATPAQKPQPAEQKVPD